ncbi:predicted protein [Verticillium alfalfae VaMs.102]|uniref:Predicted protein n=1 Tax=Verticillium alfalfae (strain VaMs.102 / ATCC MYA-4576 / FGSC 10136) TaxID=526221 RepID=C9SM96_VERA1|nr:predicted protein [Verticillium alfalfae VaMs.102]EEY19911.1 predicted protein [Verticillium alfalfae VaMs.102]
MMNTHVYDSFLDHLPPAPPANTPLEGYSPNWRLGQYPRGQVLDGQGEDTSIGVPYTTGQIPNKSSPFPIWAATTNQETHGLGFEGQSEGFKQVPAAAAQPFCPPDGRHNDPYRPQMTNINMNEHIHKTHQAPSPMSITSNIAATVLPSGEAHHRDGRLSCSTTIVSVDNASSSNPASDVHTICLLATESYLSERRANWRLRGGGGVSRQCPQRPSSSPRGSRWMPYVPPGQDSDGEHGHRRRRSSTGERPTGSLLANVSRISTALWKQAMRDRLYVLRSERMALENMGQLLDWAETIAAGDKGEEMEPMRVLTAGRNLCAWLGDEVGVEMMEALE